ncbi:His-Xaa-Ser system protein HxsD [Acetomicrobium sp. S15 = DSM 107314]|uniref:His-Xaa-Ser system protein HxsD n=1 Tax=Acetomicrobium sp. S15 = DSM 107314 TaxID=2529858 RepID=UPI0018E0E0CF|nr:His-Xaa-Ser system protein HxsD [Acetomicrobium sp. S15 = DSM 107314]
MIDLKHSFVISQEKGYLVSLQKSLYSQAAIFSAAYNFIGENVIKVFPIDEESIGVLFEPKNGRTLAEVEKDAQLFINEALDQQVRVNLEREFGHVRDIIVEYAFSPVKKNP